MAALLLVPIVRVLVQPDNAWPLYPDAADDSATARLSIRSWHVIPRARIQNRRGLWWAGRGAIRHG